MSDAFEKSVRVTPRRLAMGGVLCLILLSSLAFIVGVPRDRLIPFVPVDATVYVSVRRAPTVFRATVPGDEIIQYIFAIAEKKYSTSTMLWMQEAALRSKRVSFAQFHDANGIETSMLLFDVVKDADVASSAPMHHQRIGSVELVGETGSALDVINDVREKKILSLVAQRARNYFFADAEIFVRPSMLQRMSTYALPAWMPTPSLDKNLWLQLNKKSDHWEFASRKPYLLGSALRVSPRRITPDERVHWYGVDATRILTDDSYPLSRFLDLFDDAFVFARTTFDVDAQSVLGKLDREGEIVVFDGAIPAAAVTISQPNEKLHTQLNELLRATVAYLNPSSTERTLPDKTVVTELIVSTDQWQWHDAPIKILKNNVSGHVALVQHSERGALFFSNSTSTLALAAANVDGVVWTEHCPVAAYAKDVLMLKLDASNAQLNLFPFGYIAVMPTIGGGVVGCLFNL